MEDHEHEIVHEVKEESPAKVWVQENLRVIVSIFIVAAIALGIYSYSQRTDMSNIASDSNALLDTNGEQVAEDGQMAGEAANEDQSGMESGDQAVSPELSHETDTSFVEAAAKGDGTTHLARRALMNYLEKNPRLLAHF
ncbi:MAG: hypothetical protein WDN67_01450 [Candidatus Moraniibacteriota bacterium]